VHTPAVRRPDHSPRAVPAEKLVSRGDQSNVVLRAVTFDFWSTLVDGAITPERTAQRVARLHAAIVGAGHQCTPEELRAALRRSFDRISDEARESLKDVGPPGRWAVLAEELGIPEGMIAYEVVEHAYEEITLDQLPDAMPHVHVAVEGMKRAGYRLGVICNTGTTGGRVLREVLKRHRLLEFFEATVFSNEFGLSKPHPAIFEHTLAELGGIQARHALHVGDLEELDVEGARRAGLHAARYVPEGDGQAVETDADLVVTDWRTFPEQIAEYQRTLRTDG
jgi:HAD superfamily hydrolase (TIGR01549 family)